ncbi:MAG: DsbA family oxidoreductase [Comamonas sp.]
MPSSVRIDMVSDVTCPWCAIALFNLLHALRSLEGEIQAKLHLQPLELHPSVKAGGEVRAPYLQQHQRPARVARQPCWADIRLHGLAVQLDMGQEEPRMLYNTLDAHRLLQWADNQGHNYQIALAQQLVLGYFGRGANIADHQVLADAAVAAGMNRAAALAYLAASEDIQAVREAQSFYRGMGIQTVPTFIFNHRQLLRSNQAPEAFVRALRYIAAAGAPPSMA